MNLRSPSLKISELDQPHELYRFDPDTLYEKAWIGGGTFGKVYKSLLKNKDNCSSIPQACPATVALKEIKTSAATINSKLPSTQYFYTELEIMAFCSQKNIPNIPCLYGFYGPVSTGEINQVPLFVNKMGRPTSAAGIVLSNSEEMPSRDYSIEIFTLVMSYSELGSLYNNYDKLTDLRSVNIQIDIANALYYLHLWGIIHGDIKPNNILLDSDFTARLADFGSARRLNTNDLGPINPSSCSAPELFTCEKIPGVPISTKEADIYSFGYLIWSMYTKQWPNTGISEELLPSFIRTFKQIEKVPEHCPQNLTKIIESCWLSNPCERPSAEEVKDLLIEHKNKFVLAPNTQKGLN